MQFSLFLHFIFLFLIPSSFSSGPISKPGCPDRCGNLSIPYPFGVGSDCSLASGFEISCNTSTSKAYFSTSRVLKDEVVGINMAQIRVVFRELLGVACYNESGDYAKVTSLNFFQSSPFTFSEENWVALLGCDDLAIVYTSDEYEWKSGEDKKSYASVSFCSKDTDTHGNGYCPDNDLGYPSGIGCSVSTLPGGFSKVNAELYNINTAWRSKGGLFSCSYAFIQEKVTSNKLKFTFPFSFLNNPKEFLDDEWKWKTRAPPVVRMDWRITDAKNCTDALRNATTYACQDNSVCVDFYVKGGGYLCQCKEGYQGNPYLINGCQDIDECADSGTNPCDSNSICTNTRGSVVCSCPKGYIGDGRKNGRGCIPSKLLTIFTGVGSGLGFILLLSICIILRKALQKRKIRKRKEKFFKQNGGLLLQQQKNEGTIGKTQLFLEKELEKATDNFNEIRVLGQGGQGIVYKGMLSDGMIVAIKKSKLVDKNQLEQFINELVILSGINHRNIVQLLGYCLETEVPLLVYEYLPYGTLSDLIHDSKTEFPISWSMRLKMAADIAGALAYLHCATSTPIYHRDIKSSNILLDEKYVVKVSDFGISRTISVDCTHVTTRVQGTFGYFDPEYFQSHQFTEKSDVYSFGVVLAELLTGKKPISSEEVEEEKSLVTRFLASIENNNLDAILDTQVLEQVVKEEVNAVALLARRCLNLHGRMRPTMKEVALELENLRLSKMPSAVRHDESEEIRVFEARIMMVSDTESSWTDSDIKEIPSSSSEAHPLKFQTL